ncbi:MAG: hypothetical protein AAGL99_02700 [Pseudomonadota bacterium]
MINTQRTNNIQVKTIGKDINYPTWLEYGILALILSSVIIRFTWYGNEIHYFDLAHRWVDPGAFTEHHAARDSSAGRVVAFLLMGSSIRLFGMEMAYAVLTTGLVLAFPAAYFVMVRALKVAILPAAAALAIFVLSAQSLVAYEGMFGSIEPKSFAYLCVLFGLACGFRNRRILAAILFAGAVYLHFLIGAFWGAAILLYYVLHDRGYRAALTPMLVFLCASLPLFLVIALERFGGAHVPLTVDGSSLGAIYSDFRHPHHLSPFLDMDVFLSSWLPGLLLHGVFALAILAWVRLTKEQNPAFSLWLCGLNGYMLLITGLAYLDRETHLISMFFVFRPGSLILLLTLVWGLSRIFEVTSILRSRQVVSLGLAAVLILCADSIAAAMARYAHGPLQLAESLTTSQSKMVQWVHTHTDEQAVIVIEPLPEAGFFRGERELQWVGMERLLKRPTLVNFKLVPTDKADLARWYNLLHWREAVFAGNCDRLSEHPIHYLMARTPESVERLNRCAHLVWQGEDTAILRVASNAQMAYSER